jgi:hypothetical protein
MSSNNNAILTLAIGFPRGDDIVIDHSIVIFRLGEMVGIA